MKEIKFKGKTKEGKWVYGNNLVQDTEHNTFHLGTVKNEGAALTQVEHVCQFTGLKDNRGNDIYDYDIFEVNEGIKRIIKYDDDAARFVTVRMEDYGDHKRRYMTERPDKTWWEYFKKDIHVIDNLFDIPNYKEIKFEED